MERIVAAADLSIRRGCGFAAFGIGSFMLGLSFDLAFAVRTGAILFTAMIALLLLLAERRYAAGFRDTEMWILLDRRHDLPLPEDRVHGILRGVLRDTHLRYARLTAYPTGALWLLYLGLWLSGRT